MRQELYIYLYFPNKKGKYVCINIHTHNMLKNLSFFFLLVIELNFTGKVSFH